MPCLGEIITKLNTQHSDIIYWQLILACTKCTVDDHYCPPKCMYCMQGITLPYHQCDKLLQPPNSVENYQQITCEARCNGLELCTRRISCFHAFWCFPRPILAIFHIANVFLSGYILYQRSSHIEPGMYCHYGMHGLWFVRLSNKCMLVYSERYMAHEYAIEKNMIVMFMYMSAKS